VSDIYLRGADAVERAGERMQSAANEMECVVANLSGVLERHERFMERLMNDWLDRFAAIVERGSAPAATPEKAGGGR